MDPRLEWLVPLFVSPIFLVEVLACVAFGGRKLRLCYALFVTAVIAIYATVLLDLNHPNKALITTPTGFVIHNTAKPKAVLPSLAVARVKAVALNPADAKAFNRLASVPFLRWIAANSPSYDFAGIITDVGSGCGDIKVGDEVFGQGAGVNREFAVVMCSQIARLPHKISFAQGAAATTVGYTALVGMRTLKAKDTVLIIGSAGGCGQAGVVNAKLKKAGEIICVASGKNKDKSLALGCNKFYDYTQSDFKEKIVRDLKGKVDFIYDTVTEPLPVPGPYLLTLMPTLKETGLYVALNPSLDALRDGNYKRFQTFMAAPSREEIQYMADQTGFFQDVAIAHTGKGIDVASANEAYEMLGSHRTVGKIVLTIGDQKRSK